MEGSSGFDLNDWRKLRWNRRRIEEEIWGRIRVEVERES
jgi:hypothetical protein